jgi:hypothetical protein
VTDHRKQAESYLTSDYSTPESTATAQVYATLALVDAVDRLREALTVPKKLSDTIKVRRQDIEGVSGEHRLADYNPRRPCTCGHALGSHDASHERHPCLRTVGYAPCPCIAFAAPENEDV